MAKLVETTESLVSDLSGKPATESRQYAIGSERFALDLTEAEAEVFDRWAAKYAEKARPVTSAYRPSDGMAAKIREWANANGHEVGARGRISGEVREAFLAAQGTASE